MTKQSTNYINWILFILIMISFMGIQLLVWRVEKLETKVDFIIEELNGHCNNGLEECVFHQNPSDTASINKHKLYLLEAYLRIGLKTEKAKSATEVYEKMEGSVPADEYIERYNRKLNY